MKVSVVVPVYNPGRYLSDLVDSLAAQTLPTGEFEVIYVDDGSTDGTSDVLDRIADRTPNARVIHIPNSGWPGRPRNVGIDAALGDYVFLSDHDDRLDPSALERITGFADEHGSDVVIGRIVGVGRRAPTQIFARTVVDAQDDPGLLMTSLTPQKLFRRAFLAEQGIRFPEGRRRLEDHVFVTAAYLRAKRVSIYADHPVYYFVIRDDGGNASRRPIEWLGYFANAAESIALVDAEARDEPTRVTMRARWLHVEALGRLHAARYLEREPDDRAELTAAARGFVERHYPAAEVARLDAGDRLVARLLLDRRDVDLTAFAEWEASLRVRPHLESAVVDAPAQALRLAFVVDQRATLPRPAFLAEDTSGLPTASDLDGMERVPRTAQGTVRLRHTGGGPLLAAEARQAVANGVLKLEATVDLGGRPELLREGRWRVQITFRGLRRVRAEALTVPEDRRARVDVTAALAQGRRYRPIVSGAGRLMLRVDDASVRSRLSRLAARVLARVRRPVPVSRRA